MFARCARIEPAIMSASRPSFAFSTLSTPPSCTTLACSAFTARLNVPLPPLMVTLSAAIVAVTPCGRVTGCFATRDMATPSSRNDAQHFAAVTGSARLAIAHHTARRRHDRDAEPTEHGRQLVFALVHAQAGTADALQPVDDRAALVVLQLDGQRRLDRKSTRLNSSHSQISY